MVRLMLLNMFPNNYYILLLQLFQYIFIVKIQVPSIEILDIFSSYIQQLFTEVEGNST